MSDNKIMLWTPWEWQEMTSFAPGEEPQGTTIMQSGGHYVCHQFNIRPIEQRQQLASAIVLAVNNTYGSGINPEAVGDLLKALKEVISVSDRKTDIYDRAKAAIEKATIK